MISEKKVLLIGGTSHVGKTTFAKCLADQAGWSYRSTDDLARHPGRPWRDNNSPLPDAVVEYYSKLSVQEQVNSVMGHYRQNVWPIIDAIVHSHLNNPYAPSLVFEGSAILPDNVHAASYDRVDSVWLTAPDEVIAHQITRESRRESRSLCQKQLIDSFMNRSLKINEIFMKSVSENGQRSLDTSTLDSSNAFKIIFNSE